MDSTAAATGASPAQPGPPPARFAAPETYTPKHLAAKILTSKGSLEGERKQVTVLFADMKGSMELLAERDPEEARRILDPVLERMMEAVHHYEGTVNQVMGDGIMALFGAPLAHEDHAVRACYAALRMQDTVKRYAEEIYRTHGVPLQIRVGLNSGEVVVRTIGSDLHMDYTAVGQTTHLAARMEQMAMPGSILIPPETLSLAEGYVMVKSLGALPVKGAPAPIEVYEVVGVTTVRSRLQATAARGLTRFVGRDTEIDQLRQAIERARTGHGQVVAVVGEAGVGKSRLFWEFTHSHRTQGWLIFESSSVAYGKATAFLPLIDLLRAYFPIETRDDARRIREKVTGKLLSLDRALEPSLSALLWLLDVPVDDPQWQRFDPPQRRQQTLDGIKRVLLRESQVQPILILFEDLHWIDEETQALLDSLVESLPTARILMLVNYRPEYQHAWGSKSYYRQLRIDPLPPESAEALLEALLGTDAGLAPLKQLLIERTEGNPFFLEESIRTLVETKVLVGERGAYRLARTAQSVQIPATAQAILAARIDRLDPEDKRLLQAASVIGKDVPFALLRAVVESPEEELRLGLSHLQAGEFLYEARLFPDLEYTFKHALIHDVAYGGLLQERRYVLHKRIMDAIERLYPDRLGEQVDRLAYHAFRGEVWDKALSYLEQAGGKAFARSANREAVACFEQALVALGHHPETHETLERAIELRLDLRNSLIVLGELQRVIDYLREAEALAKQIDDQPRLSRMSLYMSHVFLVSGYPTEARTFAERAHTIAEALSELPLRIGASIYLGAAYLAGGDYRGAEELLRKAAQLVEGERSYQRFGMHGFPAVLSRFYLAWSLAERGAFNEAIPVGQESIRIAEAVDHPYSLGLACWRLGNVYLGKGDLAQAIPMFERALTHTREWNVALLPPLITESLGHAHVLSGRLDDGMRLLHEALKSMEGQGSGQYLALGLLHLGEAYVHASRLELAARYAEQALALVRERGNRAYEGWALRLLGEIASHQEHADPEAEAHYLRALALADELELRPLAAHCHLGLGRHHQRGRNPDRAQQHVHKAAAMFREMEMTFWLVRTETGVGLATVS
jgi:class 3 adenylate cyclase/tetratricopeptide (TPR) repeat protein